MTVGWPFTRIELDATAASTDRSSAFDAEYFHFHGLAMSGQQEQRPRWKRALDEENERFLAALAASIGD